MNTCIVCREGPCVAPVIASTMWCTASNVQTKVRVFNSMRPRSRHPSVYSLVAPLPHTAATLGFVTPLDESRTAEHAKVYNGWRKVRLAGEGRKVHTLVTLQTSSLAFLPAHSWSPHECRVVYRPQLPARPARHT